MLAWPRASCSELPHDVVLRLASRHLCSLDAGFGAPCGSKPSGRVRSRPRHRTAAAPPCGCMFGRAAAARVCARRAGRRAGVIDDSKVHVCPQTVRGQAHALPCLDDVAVSAPKRDAALGRDAAVVVLNATAVLTLRHRTHPFPSLTPGGQSRSKLGSNTSHCFAA